MRLLALLLFASVVAIPAPAAADLDCPGRTVGVSDASRTEGGQLGGGSLTFTVWTAGCEPGSVSYQTAAATATDQVDYGFRGGTLSWGPGDTSARQVTVPIVGELVEEADETLSLILFNPVGLGISDNTGTGTIINDDVYRPVFELGEPECLRIQPDCELMILVSERVSTDVVVRYATADGTALSGQDYAGVASGSVTIATGTSRAAIRIRTLAGTPGEYFYVKLLDRSVSARVTFA